MESKLALRICSKLLEWKIISKELEEIYVYGFELLLSFLTNTIIILSIGAISHQLSKTLVFLLVFILVRRYTGGFHADTYLKCKVFTVGTYLFVMVCSSFVNASLFAFALLSVAGLIIIIKWGPIENPNKPLTAEEKRRHRIIGTIIFQTFLICGCATISLSFALSNVLFYSLFSIIALMLYEILRERIYAA